MCVAPLGCAADDIGSVSIERVWRRGECSHRERIAWHPVDQESRVRGVFRKSGQILTRNLASVFRELLRENHGVVAADLEGDDGSDIAPDGICGLLVELGQVLVSDGETQPVFASFREYGREAAGREILELVDVQEEIPAVCFGLVSPRHRSLLDTRHEKCPEFHNAVIYCVSCGFVLADDGQLGDWHDPEQIAWEAELRAEEQQNQDECDLCGTMVEEVVICPNGKEICWKCFNEGQC